MGRRLPIPRRGVFRVVGRLVVGAARLVGARFRAENRQKRAFGGARAAPRRASQRVRFARRPGAAAGVRRGANAGRGVFIGARRLARTAGGKLCLLARKIAFAGTVENRYEGGSGRRRADSAQDAFQRRSDRRRRERDLDDRDAEKSQKVGKKRRERSVRSERRDAGRRRFRRGVGGGNASSVRVFPVAGRLVGRSGAGARESVRLPPSNDARLGARARTRRRRGAAARNRRRRPSGGRRTAVLRGASRIYRRNGRRRVRPFHQQRANAAGDRRAFPLVRGERVSVFLAVGGLAASEDGASVQGDEAERFIRRRLVLARRRRAGRRAPKRYHR